MNHPFLRRSVEAVRTFYFAVVLLVAGVCAAHAATITEVEIRPDTASRTYGRLIEANTSLGQGSELDPGALSEDIKRLYGTGKFRRVDAYAEEMSDGGLRLVYQLEVLPVVRTIRIEGNERFKAKKLRKKLEHSEGEVLDERQLDKDAEAIRQHYRDKGYIDTSVAAVTEPSGKGGVDVVFRVAESGRSKVRKVRFEGNEALKDGKLRSAMETEATWLGYVFSTGFLKEQVLHADRSRLAKLYAEAGYLDFSVENIEYRYSDNGEWVTLVLHLDEGEMYTVSGIRITGNKRFGAEELRALLALSNADRFSAAEEQKGARAIANRYYNEGHLDARCVVDREKNPGESTVDLVYRIVEAVPCTVRTIEIKGNRITQDRVIRRELGVYPGDLADKRKIDSAKRKLMNLDYFEAVDIIPLVTERERERDLRVSVKETETGRLMLGGGFSTEDDLVGMFEIAQTNFALLNWPTFRGGGQKLRLNTQLGTEITDFMLSFTEPWLFHRRLQLTTDLFVRSRDYDEYTRDKTGAAVSLTRRWLKNWRQRLGVRVESIELSDFDQNTTSVELREEAGDYDHNVLSISLIRDVRDSFMTPRRGSRLVFSGELQAEAWGSYSDIYSVQAALTRYFPLFNESAFKLSGEIATVDSLSDDDVAIFDRLFAGGVGSVRGFESRDVGPVDSNQDPIGGKSRLSGTAEIQVPLVDMVRWRAFCDFGNVWEDAADWNPAEVNASVGMGVELRLPIGPLSFDYGIPVVTEQDYLEDDGRLHFNVGYTF